MSIGYAESLSNATVSATGAGIQDPRLLDRAEYEANERRTHVTLAEIADPVLRETLTRFDDILGFDQAHAVFKLAWRVGVVDTQRYGVDSEELQRALELVRLRADAGLGRVMIYVTVGEIEDPHIPSPVNTVKDIADILGIPVADVLSATGISKRTYHAWKKNGVKRPRRSSLGRLWELHQLVHDILEVKGSAGIQRWITEDPQVLELLRTGSINTLAAQAYGMSTTEPRPDWVLSGGPTERLRVNKSGVELQAMDPTDIVEPES